jgi:hypothetical protein
MEYPNMKRLVIRCAAFGAGLMWTGLASPFGAPAETPVTGTLAAYFDDEQKKEEPPATPAAPAEETKVADNGGCAEEPSCEAEDSCGDEVACGDAVAAKGIFCDDWCTLCIDDCWPFCCCCDYGEACTLKSHLTPNCCNGPTYGGWISFGYYNKPERLSFNDGDSLSFNDFPDHLNLDQLWLYVEKAAKTDGCNADFGYRYDIMYGVHGHAAQAYGNPRAFEPVFGKNLGSWDASLDHGPYAWAMPQLYGEVGYNDWSIKVGRFFTPVGYEVIPDTGNFFYSHSLTHYNSEPFTHTGVLGTYKGNDSFTPFAGWALGWDTGFDQFLGGNIFIGGFTQKVTDNVAFTYGTTAGNQGWFSGGQDGYTQHIVTTAKLSSKWDYVFQSDWATANGTITDATFDQESGGITNYLFYTVNDCWKLGGRVEWWKSNNVVTGDNVSFYDVTAGVNYKASANTMIRPEIRYDWTPAEDTVNAALGDFYNQWWFGIDVVTTF